MAVADIFEALTAADRPYKPAKKLSESIRIMSFMVKDNHIDPDIFRLFLESGVYREYADKFLKPEQIDAVDVTVSAHTSHTHGVHAALPADEHVLRFDYTDPAAATAVLPADTTEGDGEASPDWTLTDEVGRIFQLRGFVKANCRSVFTVRRT